MSVYAVRKLCYLSEQDPELRSRLQSDPRETIKEFGLTPEEAQALLEGDVGKLYRMGVDAFLLQFIGIHRLFGMTLETYNERIKDEASPRQ